MSAEPLPFDQVETHLECPQKWEYDHALGVQPEENTRSFDRRRTLLRTALLTVFNASPGSAEAAARSATGFVDRHWRRFTDDGLYLSERQESFDKAVTKRALRTYLTEYWDDHLESIVDNGTTASVQIDGTEVTTEVDLLGRGEDGSYVVYEYAPTLRNVSYSNTSENRAEQYRSREEYTGRNLPSILRAEVAIRGVAAERDLDTEVVRYVVVGLHESVTTADGSGDDGVAVDQECRELTDWHREYGASNYELLAETVRGIDREDTAIPSEWQRDLLESTCRYCPFKDMCKPRFNWEVEF